MSPMSGSEKTEPEETHGMPRISVRHEHDDHYHVRIRHHGLVVDQPPEEGGADLGPSPTELFAASLAACAAFYAGRFLRRHAIPPAGLRVDCDFEMSPERPARVTAVRLDLWLPPAFPEERREALERVVERCAVRNSLRIPPEVTVALREVGHAA